MYGFGRYRGSSEVTPREIMVSIIIVLVVIALGILIVSGVTSKMEETNEYYYKAMKIENDSEMFNYAQKTDAGNALVYGKILAVDKVSMPEISKEFLYLSKTKEKYTMHTRTVSTTINGKTTTRLETYWTWDYAGSDSVTSKEIEIFENKYPVSLFKINGMTKRFDLHGNKSIVNYVNGLDEIKSNYLYEDSHTRYYYDYIPTEFNANFLINFKYYTINPISEVSERIELNSGTIAERIEKIEGSVGFAKVIIWVVIGVLTTIGIVYFVSQYHHWLEKGR